MTKAAIAHIGKNVVFVNFPDGERDGENERKNSDGERDGENGKS